MPAIHSGRDRATSVSSMRRMKVPASCRANSQLNKAVRAPPTCREPVGAGENRTRGASAIDLLWSPSQAPALLRPSAKPPPPRPECRGGELRTFGGLGPRGELVEELAGDHDALDLVRALVDLGHLRVSHHSLDGELAR